MGGEGVKIWALLMPHEAAGGVSFTPAMYTEGKAKQKEVRRVAQRPKPGSVEKRG